MFDFPFRGGGQFITRQPMPRSVYAVELGGVADIDIEHEGLTWRWHHTAYAALTIYSAATWAVSPTGL
ncbi:hypothetical protein GR247_02910 [Rhizobium leguminosarum]|nr:hypothetical protein [Rhizobium leguminosarum]NKK54614.1 hypothetical protein [Rhizobium leguminosarum bv. viciae]TBB61198.1 hypothetical protein ELH42_25330 [Rhizobium ruizarguesonis]TBB85013.1 hypothetical protein ELH39_27770 [Rhizobium ruizarguesonis]